MTTPPMTTMSDPSLELVYAIAQIRWNVDEESGTVGSPAEFGGPERENWSWLKMYLDQEVFARDAREIAVSMELSNVPAEALLKEGAPFSLRFGYREGSEAEGRVVAVRRAAPAPSDALFQASLLACRKPTTDVLREALAGRATLTRDQADHIGSLAGFTHHAEAASVLGEFGMTVQGRMPSLIDRPRRTRHVKVLLNDLVHEALGLAVVPIAERHRRPTFRNRVQCREPNGTYISTFPPRGEDHEAYWRFMDSLEMGLGELVTAVLAPPHDSSAERLLLHAARLPARNTGENLERLFCNVGVILTAYENSPRFNLSFEHLRECGAIQPSLARALWVILETEDVGVAVDAVRQIGADYVVLPYEKTRQDYLEEITPLIWERL